MMALPKVKVNRSGGKAGERWDRRAIVKWASRRLRRIDDRKASSGAD